MFNSTNKELERALQDGKAVLLGNLPVNSQIDAVLMRRDSIVVLEMKNYAGHVNGSENDEWTCTSSSAMAIKAGRENPFDQVRKYRGNVVDKLKEVSELLGVQRAKDTRDRWIHFVSGLVLFNKISSFTTSIDHQRSCPSLMIGQG